MKRFALPLVVTLSLAALAGCSVTSADSSMSGGGESSSYAPSSGSGGSPSSPGGGKSATAPGAPEGSVPSGSVGEQTPSASVLTVGLWDDNKNFVHFERYLEKTKNVGSQLFDVRELAAKNIENLQAPGAKTALDVTFLVDTTGSMGDELSYLTRELVAIQNKVHQRVQDAHYGVVTYRDRGDEYVTRSTELSADPALARDALSRESAAGGGDHPEAVPDGLAAAAALGWRQEPNVAKVLFWIADAPEHRGTGPAVAAALASARAKGIHVYPIAASGVVTEAEHTMRVAAQYTGGRYIFLTDDSGIGSAHAEPLVPCYVVQKLDAAILRVLRIEASGAYEAAAPEEIVRTAGTVDARGRCTVTTTAKTQDGTAHPLAEAWIY